MKSCYSIIIGLVFFLSCTAIFGQNIDSLERILESDLSNHDKAQANILLSKYYLTRDLKLVKEYATQATQLSSEADSLQIESYDQLAKYHFFTSSLDSALMFFKKAQAAANLLDKKEMIATFDISIGSVLLRMGRFEEAISTFIQSAEFFESAEDDFNAAKCYANVSSAFARLENYEESIKYNERALTIFKDKEDENLTIVVLPNLATQYVKVQDTVRAFETFKEAESLAIKIGNDRALSIIYTNLGDLYLSKKEWPAAKVYTSRSIELKKKMSQTVGLSQAYHNMGFILSQEGNPRAAIKMYDLALLTSSSDRKIVIYNKLSENYKAIGNLGKALEYAELSIVQQDSVTAATNLKAIAEINAKYETAKQENEILQLESDKQQLLITKNANRAWLIGVIAVLLISLLSFYQYFKNQKRKRLIDLQKHELNQQKMLEKLKQQELESIDKIIQSQEDERARIASDLHDSLGSKMATLKLFVDNIDAQKVDTLDQEMISKTKDLVHLTYNEVREISHQINGGVSIGKGLLPALKEMAAYISQSSKIDAQIIDVDMFHKLENSIELQLFRTIQELITNAVKHSGADSIKVFLTGHEDVISIVVEDNGKGYDVEKTTQGMGLSNVSKRLDTIGATLEVDSILNEGTSILINLGV